MINLRYHIVSIVAVFLALGIGLALGSTFVDSVLVSNLESQVDQLEEDTVLAVAERDAAVDRQEELLIEKREFDALATPLLGRDRLADRSVVIVAPDSVEREQLDRLRDLVVSSEASFAGVLWVTNSFDLRDGATRSAVAQELDLAGDSEAALTRALTFLITQAFFSPEEAGTADGAVPSVLTVLRDAGLLVYDPTFGGGEISRLGSATLDLLFVTDAGAELINQQLIAPLLTEFEDDGYAGRSVLVEIDSDFDYGEVVALVRSSAELRAAVTTVDGVRDYEGALAVMLALAELPDVGHYGRLASADSRLPE